MVVGLPLALLYGDLATLYFHYIGAVIKADENNIDLTVIALVRDWYGRNDHPRGVEIRPEMLNDSRFRMLKAGNIKVSREELRHSVSIEA